MAYQEKYNYTFVSIDGKTNLVEIWQDTAETLTAEEVKCGSMPFTVELPEVDHKIQPVWGKGCNVELISDVSFKFFTGLYHVDKKEFIVKHYIDSAINFLGYLNSEMSRESYTDYSNYQVSVIGNDGFSLLERIQFLQDDGSLYTGVKSFFEILTICIDRIELPFSAINIALSTTSTLITIGADETLFHHQFIDCANFINEDGEAETMRKVLESILQPFGAIITQESGAIWVTDLHTKAGAAGITFKSFVLATTWDYDTDINFVQLKSISTVGYNGTGSDIERSGGKNKQTVSYSPYPIKEILPTTLNDLSEFSGEVPADYSEYGYYKYKVLTDHNALTVYSPAQFEYSYRFKGITTPPETTADACVGVRWYAGTAATKILELALTPTINIKHWFTDDEQGILRKSFRSIGIKIGGEIQFNRNYTASGKETDGGVNFVSLKGKFKIGDKYGSGDSWSTLDQYFDIIVSKSDQTSVTCQWVTMRSYFKDVVLFRNSEDLSGQIYLEIYSQINYIDTNGTAWNNTSVHHASVRLRNLSIEIVDGVSLDEIEDNDIEYIGYLDPKQKDEAEKIELICGSDICFTDRGKIMYNNSGTYSAMDTWTRAAQSDRIETLLLNTLSSNYRAGYLTLDNLKLFNSFNSLHIFGDTFLDSAILMPKSMKINYRDNVIECSLQEIFQDELTIVPL